MKIFVISLYLLVLTSCATNLQQGICDLAPSEEGWLNVDKPLVVKDNEKPSAKKYYEWFQNNDGELLRCERFKKSPGCFEEGEYFNAKTGEKIYKDSLETIIIACGS